MKTSFLFQISIALFVMTSCSKEALVTPITDDMNYTQQHINVMPSTDENKAKKATATAQSSQNLSLIHI